MQRSDRLGEEAAETTARKLAAMVGGCVLIPATMMAMMMVASLVPKRLGGRGQGI